MKIKKTIEDCFKAISEQNKRAAAIREAAWEEYESQTSWDEKIKFIKTYAAYVDAEATVWAAWENFVESI